MELRHDIEDILIKDCTKQELSQHELEILNIWLNETEKNQRIYAQLKISFLHPRASDLEKTKKEVWADVQQRAKVLKNHEGRGKLNIYQYWIKIAAVFVFLVSIGFILYQINHIEQAENPAVAEIKMVGKVSPSGKKITSTLPDGTIVNLNGDSHILYNENFFGDTREITLYGEAFFDVARDESKPFIIKTKDLEVEVLGTSFNVKSYPGKETTVVSVATGKVAVTNMNQQTVSLNSGERLFYQSDIGNMILGNYVDWEEEFGWKENILVFRENTLNEIVDRLRKWYGVEFIMEGEMPDGSRRFSGRYTDPTLKATLEGLSFVYGFNYSLETKTVILKF